MKVIATYRWSFNDGAMIREYAEAVLVEDGSRYYLMVDLVRDDIRSDGKIIDPDLRQGVRIFCESVHDKANDPTPAVRTLAYMSPIEGHRFAYKLIFDAVANSPRAVEKYGSKWLTDLMAEMAGAT